MIRKYHIGICISIWCIIICLPLKLMADADKSSEYRIKAAYLYNFAKFVEWPAASFKTPDDPIILYILGDPPFGDALEIIKNKTIRGRSLIIRQGRDIKDIKGCHILFVSASEKAGVERILSKVRGQPLLTVSDMKGFAHKGGMINFIWVGKKIRFEVNLDAAERASIKISSRLLKIAILVKKDNPMESMK